MINFYVHIVESPSPADLLDGRTEGRALCAYLDTACIPYQYNLAVDKKQFDNALSTVRVFQAMRYFEALPILHLSAHGDERGIQLTNQRANLEVVSWSELSEFMKPIRELFPGLGVCMSSCGGWHGKRMAEVIRREDVPFAWLVGSSSDIDLRDAALAFAIFYRRFHCGQLGSDQMGEQFRGIRVASNVPDFEIVFGHEIHSEYTDVYFRGLAALLNWDTSTKAGEATDPQIAEP